MSFRMVLTELWKCSYSTFEDECQGCCDCPYNTSDVSMDCFALPTCIYKCIKLKKQNKTKQKTKTKSIDLKDVWKRWQSYILCNETVSLYTKHTLDFKLKIKLVQFTQKNRIVVYTLEVNGPINIDLLSCYKLFHVNYGLQSNDIMHYAFHT